HEWSRSALGVPRRAHRLAAPVGAAGESRRRSIPGGGLSRRAHRSAAVPNRLDELALVHAASPLDVELRGSVPQLLDAPILEGRVRVAGPPRCLVRRLARLPALLVHRAGGDLLGSLGAGTA